jgi:sugar phosphate isomerase/epimerase
MTTKSRLPVGVSHLAWGFDVSPIDRLEGFLDDATGIGFQGIVCFDTTVSPWIDRPEDFLTRVRRRKLELVGVILRPGLDYVFTDRLAKFMAAVGGGKIMILSGPCGSEGDWNVVVPALEHHGQIAARAGIRAVYHHHTAWIAETMEQTERLLADTDPKAIGAMLDCGHATKDFVGHSAEEFFRRNQERIAYVEFKDWTPETDLRTEVGRGRCNWTAVAQALRELKYQEWIVVEQNGTVRTPKTSSAESLRFIRETLEL